MSYDGDTQGWRAMQSLPLSACESCTTEEQRERLASATKILAAVDDGQHESYDDSASCTVFEAAAGKVGVFKEWSDSSGHG